MKKYLHLSWGYSMTINNFYEVISETPKTALIRQIGNKRVEGDGWMGREEANPDEILTEVDWKATPPNGEKVLKERIYKVFKTNDGYKGKLNLSRTHYLSEISLGTSKYFNHLD